MDLDIFGILDHFGTSIGWTLSTLSTLLRHFDALDTCIIPSFREKPLNELATSTTFAVLPIPTSYQPRECLMTLSILTFSTTLPSRYSLMTGLGTNFNNLFIVNRSPTLLFISAVLHYQSHHSCKYLHSSHTTSILSPT